jgi:hypothetical protein
LYTGSFPDLPDGDVVTVTEEAGGDPNQIELCLVLTNNVTWWKGIVVRHVKSGGYRTIADIANVKNVRQCGLTSPIELSPAATDPVELFLSKAKVFGIHDNTYRISNAFTAFHVGRRIVFTWSKD